MLDNKCLCECCFFLILRRPPRSTLIAPLCPYTTLFRSIRAELAVVLGLDLALGDVLDVAAAADPAGADFGEAGVDVDGGVGVGVGPRRVIDRSEEHTSELQSLMRISYAVFCLKKKKQEHQAKMYILRHNYMSIY